MQRRPYRGVLIEPMVIEELYREETLASGGGTPEASRKAEADFKIRLAEALGERWSALCQHYETSDPYVLAFQLATDHVSGFQFSAARSRGRKKEWDALRLNRLYATFLHLRPKFASDRSTLQHIARSRSYRHLTGGVKPDRLKDLLREATNAEKNPTVLLLAKHWIKDIFIEHFAVKKVGG